MSNDEDIAYLGTKSLFRTDSDSILSGDDGETTEDAPSTRIEQIMHVEIEQVSMRVSIAQRLWPAAQQLALFVLNVKTNEMYAQLHTILQLDSISILELGAGVGFTGLELATQMPARVLLTDLAEGLPLLQSNTSRNSSRFVIPNAVSVQKLEWGIEEDAIRALDYFKEYQTPLLALGADCVYWEELHEPLERALFHILSRAPQGSLCLLAGMRRRKRDNKFYQNLGKRTCTATHELRCTCMDETVERHGAKREIMRIFAVEWVQRQDRRCLQK
jgi:hypothetical protein